MALKTMEIFARDDSVSIRDKKQKDLDICPGSNSEWQRTPSSFHNIKFPLRRMGERKLVLLLLLNCGKEGTFCVTEFWKV